MVESAAVAYSLGLTDVVFTMNRIVAGSKNLLKDLNSKE